MVLSTTAGLTALMLWMALLLTGPIILIPAAGAWLVWLIVFRRFGKRSPALFMEYVVQTAMLGAQVSLILAIAIMLFPNLL